MNKNSKHLIQGLRAKLTPRKSFYQDTAPENLTVMSPVKMLPPAAQSGIPKDQEVNGAPQS